jgi:tRNA-(ms[2]io[6]A)-hydroxylase
VEIILPLVQEELSHFRIVFEIVQRRGYRFGKDKGDPYVTDLLAHRWKQEPDNFLDNLLIAAIIEARSCERFKLLAEHISDPELRDLYSVLSASEARHYTTYLNLAKNFFPAEHVNPRLDELLEIEKKIVLALPNEPRIHG